MPLTATLALDVKQFEDGLKKADVELQTFERATKSMNRELKRLLEDFSGQKVAVEAARMAAAVERVGGATKLTEANQRRVNAVVEEAIAQYRALGEQAPAHLLKLAEETRGAGDSVGFLDGKVAQLAAGFTVGALADRAVTSLVKFGAEAVTSAGHLLDLRNKTGLSTTALQQMQEVANQTGTGLEAFTDATFKLGVNLAKGSQETRQAVEALGLSYETLKGQLPEEQFNNTIAALERVDNQQERNRLGVALFGKQFSEIAAAVEEGYTDIAQAARLSSQQQIEALDAAGDAWQKFTDDVSTGVRSGLGEAVLYVRDTVAAATLDINKYTADQQKRIRDILGEGGGGLAAYLDAVAKARTTDIDLVPASGAEAFEGYAAALRKVQAEVASLTPAQRAEIDAATALGAKVDEVAEKYGVSEQAIRLYTSGTRAATAASREYAEALAKLSGQDALKQAATAAKQIAAIGGPLKVVPGQLGAVATQIKAGAEAARVFGNTKLAEQYEALAKELQPLEQLQKRYNVRVGEFVTLNPSYTDAVLEQNDAQNETRDTINFGVLPAMAKYLEMMGRVPPTVREASTEVAGFGDHLKENLGDALADVPRAIQNALENGGDWEAAAASIASSFGAAIGRSVGESIAPGVGGEVGAAVGAMAGLIIDPLIKTAGEDVVERVGHDWGVRLSEAMGNAIAEDAKRMFGGNRQAAELFNFDKILGEAGGLSNRNADGFLRRFRDVFVMLETGAFDAVDAVEVLDENFGAFAEHFAQDGELVSAQFLEIIELARRAGLEVDAISEFTSKQIGNASGGMAAFLEPGAEAMKAVADGQQELARLQGELAKAGVDDQAKLQAEIQKVTAEMAKQQAIASALGVTTEQGAAGAGAALAAMFGQLREDGASIPEALRQVQPAAAALQAQLSAAGLSGGAAFEEISRMAALASDEVAGPVLTGVSGINDALLGLSNTGLITEEMFDGLGAQTAQAFEALVGQGKNGDDVLKLMQPTLQTLSELQERFGFSLDEGTAKLVDQAREAGIVGDKYKSSNDRMLEATERLAEVMEGFVSALSVDLPQAAGRAKDAIDKIPRQVDFRVSGRYEGPDVPGSGAGGNGETENYNVGTMGVHGSWFHKFDRAGERVNVHGDEAIIRPDQAEAFARDVLGPRRGGPAAGGGVSVSSGGEVILRVPVMVDGRQIAEAVAPLLPDALRFLGV